MHRSEYANIMTRLPPFEPPYEYTTHKDVRGNDRLYMALPFGKRHFAWFTHYKNQNVCFLIELSLGHTINMKRIYPIITSFDSRLSLGTILYGTIVHKDNTSCFVMDDIIYDTGCKTASVPYINKVHRFKDMCENQLGHTIYHPKQVLFVLPEMDIDMMNMAPKIPLLQYPFYCIMSVNLYGNTKRVKVITKNNTQIKGIFLIKPRIKSDTYELHVYDNNKTIFHGFASIDTYIRSVAMNNLFRTIKENHYLDAIEESDDEDDFQNISPEKYVHLDRQIKMLCRWNPRFKRWIPLDKVDDKNQLITMKEAIRLERQAV